jgi:hypothetical protein
VSNESTQTVQSNDVAVKPVDRRRSPRTERRMPGWLSDQSGGRRPSQQKVTVTDMSLHGLGFLAKEPLTPGATHWIVVASEQLHLSTRLRIINVRQLPGGEYDIGAEFF